MSEPPAPSIRISLPPRWRRTDEPETGVLVRALGPPIDGIRPEVTLAMAATDLERADFADDVLEEMALRLDAFALEDDDEYDLLASPVSYRRCAFRRRGHEMLADLWVWRPGPWGLTLTCAVPRDAYWSYSDLFEVIAESVGLEEVAA